MIDPHVMRPGHAPTPFTADEIRSECLPGREMKLLVEPAGASRFVRVIRFIDGDAESAVQEAQMFSVAGEPIDEPTRGRTEWSVFQSHASYPADDTTIEQEEIEIPAGTFDCLRYTVRRDDGVETFWFAKELPGMPVKVVTEENGAITFEMTMIANQPGQRPAGRRDPVEGRTGA